MLQPALQPTLSPQFLPPGLLCMPEPPLLPLLRPPLLLPGPAACTPPVRAPCRQITEPGRLQHFWAGTEDCAAGRGEGPPTLAGPFGPAKGQQLPPASSYMLRQVGSGRTCSLARHSQAGPPAHPPMGVGHSVRVHKLQVVGRQHGAHRAQRHALLVAVHDPHLRAHGGCRDWPIGQPIGQAPGDRPQRAPLQAEHDDILPGAAANWRCTMQQGNKTQ